MKNLLLATTSVLFLPLAAAQTPAAAPAPAVEEVYKPTSLTPAPGLPRTADGHPDLQGAVWATNFFPVFEASPMASKLVVTEAESRKIVATMVGAMTKSPDFAIDPEAGDIIGGTDGLPLVRGERRSRLIVLPPNGKIPMTPEAQKIATASGGGKKDDYEQRPSGERCIALSGGPPLYFTVSYNRLRIVQTREHVVIHTENGDEVRIIPFATSHRPEGPTNLYGDSIARWEGDTLVIETVRQPKSENIRGLFQKFLVNPEAIVIERLTRVSKHEMVYQFTVEDPNVYTAPWLGEYSFYAADTGMFPSPCHEHNYSLPNILLGQRMADLKAGAKD